MRVFAEIIEEYIHELAPACTAAELAAETIVGGIHDVAYRRILAGQTEDLPGLVEDLLATIMVSTAGEHELGRSGGYSPAPAPGRVAAAEPVRHRAERADEEADRPAGLEGRGNREPHRH
jgi:hypothetical protein